MPLHIEKELNAMLDRGFSPELVEKLVACRQARWKAGATSTTKSGNPCSGPP